MERRNVDILCLQKTKWKESKARNVGGGCELLNNGADGRKNGIGIVVREELVKIALEVKRVSERLNGHETVGKRIYTKGGQTVALRTLACGSLNFLKNYINFSFVSNSSQRPIFYRLY